MAGAKAGGAGKRCRTEPHGALFPGKQLAEPGAAVVEPSGLPGCGFKPACRPPLADRISLCSICSETQNDVSRNERKGRRELRRIVRSSLGEI
jgi:hypothetical protein